MRIHLDAIGGVAGDMFIAAVLDAFPQLEQKMLSEIRATGLPNNVKLNVIGCKDKALAGKRFEVDETSSKQNCHKRYSDITKMLAKATINEKTKKVALQIFSLLGGAESEVHGKELDSVSFHELGHWDSVADIVGAAYLISQLDASWTVSSLPLGKGMVNTAHGNVPVPAPATAKLLEGFDFHDDGEYGERVTPTGAAILKLISNRAQETPEVGTLAGSGMGFGKRRFSGFSNVLRVLVFNDEMLGVQSDVIAKIDFDIDDQTSEDLAIGAESLRKNSYVIELFQTIGYGKKSRVVSHIQILARPEGLESVIEACFSETTTLGVRYQFLNRRVLKRENKLVNIDGVTQRVKIAYRPSTVTAKIEADDLVEATAGYKGRKSLKNRTEQIAVKEKL